MDTEVRGELSLNEIELVDHVLRTTRSVRRKLDFDRTVAVGTLLDCINVATQAPTGLIGEGWRFVIVTEAEQKRQLAEHYNDVLVTLYRDRGEPVKATHRALMSRLPDIPAMVFVCAEGEPSGTTPGAQLGFYGSILPAAWSLMLAMRARGLGTTWTSLLSARADAVARILQLPDGITQTVMLPVAYTLGAKLKPADRVDAREVTFINSWGRRPDDARD